MSLRRAALLVALFLGCSRDKPRAAIAAGSFYPADASALRTQVDALLEQAEPPSDPQRVQAILAPHAGYELSGKVAARAFRAVRGEARARVILLGPAHDVPAEGALLEAFTSYVTPLGAVPVDLDAMRALQGAPGFSQAPVETAKEHALEVELPFLQRALAPGWKLVPILLGHLTKARAAEVADALKPLAKGALVVASSDFTHAGRAYGFTPFAEDAAIGDRVRALDLALFLSIPRGPDAVLETAARTRINACGQDALLVLSALLPPHPKVGVSAQATSFDGDQDPKDVVGYVGATFLED